MNPRQSRRALLAAMAAMGTFPHALVRAQTPVPNAGADQGGQGPRTAVPTIKPFIEIGRFEEDKDRLFMFMQYTCPFCASLHGPIVTWAQTLPSPMKLVTIPLGEDNDATRASIFAHYAVREIAPKQLEAYSQSAYQVGQSANPTAAGYLSILPKLGLKREAVVSAINSPRTRDRVMRGLRLASRYRVTVTPTFGVAGRWTTNPGFTSGKSQDLVALLNVLVTTAIQGGDLAI